MYNAICTVTELESIAGHYSSVTVYCVLQLQTVGDRFIGAGGSNDMGRRGAVMKWVAGGQ